MYAQVSAALAIHNCNRRVSLESTTVFAATSSRSDAAQVSGCYFKCIARGEIDLTKAEVGAFAVYWN